MIAVIAGGTGSAKFVRGLCNLLSPEEVAVIVNVGDNTTMFGLYICPDIDTITYTLSGTLNLERGWGVQDDTFNFLSTLRTLGFSPWFNLGDKDLAVHVYRTLRLREKASLSEVTREIAQRLGVKSKILPASDDFLETRIQTDQGEMHLQEFWVKWAATPIVRGVAYAGSDHAKAAPQVNETLASAETVVFAPANPITSIMPILAVNEIRDALTRRGGNRVAISPIIGREAVSGPASKIMKDLELEVSPITVARLYHGLIDTLIIHTSDESLKPQIEQLGVQCAVTDILMRNPEEEKRLANYAVACDLTAAGSRRRG